MTREVEVEVNTQSVLGDWRVKCPACPLLPHWNALSMPAQPCVSGIQTNMQGAVTLMACKFYKQDTARQEGGKFVVECNHGEEKP